MKLLALDDNHPYLLKSLQPYFQIVEDYHSSYDQVAEKIQQFDVIIIRSRIPLDENLLQKAHQLKAIGRVGAGLENIDTQYCEKHNIAVFNATDGSKDTVAEHTLGLLLALLHKIPSSFEEVKKGIWKREENRGIELKGKTVGIIGYGNIGTAFAQKLSGFGTETLFYDILPKSSDDFATAVTLQELQERAEIISLHVPLNDKTQGMINTQFLSQCPKLHTLLNLARGKVVVTQDVVQAMQSGQLQRVGLDVLEYEKNSFEKLDTYPSDLQYLLSHPNVVITPHIGGWSLESKYNLAKIISDKILEYFDID